MEKWIGRPIRAIRHSKLICFTDADIDANYFSEADYSTLSGLGPTIQNAFAELDKAARRKRGRHLWQKSYKLNNSIISIGGSSTFGAFAKPQKAEAVPPPPAVLAGV